MYEYSCVVRKCVDGDTIDVDIDLGFQCWLCYQRVRLYGVDTPESRTRDMVEKKFGKLAHQFVLDFMPVGSRVILKTMKKGKYGRYLGDFKVGTKWLCKELLKHHHAVEYHGQSKAEIKEAHIENRKKIV